MTGQPEEPPKEECGVFGVWAPGEEVAKLTYYGLYALQHRGQEAAGIAVADGSQVLVFRISAWSARYSTSRLWPPCPATSPSATAGTPPRVPPPGENAQPVFRNTAAGTGVALGHNGNLVNTTELAERARKAGLINHNVPGAATTDSDILGASARRRCGGLQHRAGRPRTAADRSGRVLPGLHGRIHPLRGP